MISFLSRPFLFLRITVVSAPLLAQPASERLLARKRKKQTYSGGWSTEGGVRGAEVCGWILFDACKVFNARSCYVPALAAVSAEGVALAVGQVFPVRGSKSLSATRRRAVWFLFLFFCRALWTSRRACSSLNLARLVE